MERYYFFNSTENDQRIYQAQDFARFHHQIVGNGVSNDKNKANLSVKPKKDMNVTMGAGYMFINGYLYENTTAKDFTIDTADAGSDRIDRVIIRFDNNPEERRIYAFILKGTPGDEPKPPQLTRSGYIYDMSVAQILIKAGQSFIESEDITDERGDESVCGYIPLHNFYRAFDVSPEGIVSTKNTSFVLAYNDRPETLKGGTGSDYVRNKMMFPPNLDKQDEVIQDEQGTYNIFKPKTIGVYMFTFFVRLEKELPAGAKLQAYMQRKGDEYDYARVFLFNDTSVTGSSDVFFFGTSMEYMSAGDEYELYILTRKVGGNIKIAQRQLQISKVQ